MVAERRRQVGVGGRVESFHGFPAGPGHGAVSVVATTTLAAFSMLVSDSVT